MQTAPETRDRLARTLREQQIYTTFRYYPLHWVDYYGAVVSLPGAEEAAKTTLCIPIHQALSDQDVATVIDAIVSFSSSV